MSALGRQRPLTIVSAQGPLTGVKRTPKTLEILNSDFRFRPIAGIRQIKKPRREAGVFWSIERVAWLPFYSVLLRSRDEAMRARTSAYVADDVS